MSNPGDAPSAASSEGAAATPRKPRSLADMMAQQVAEGLISDDAAKKPVVWGRGGGRAHGGGSARRGGAFGSRTSQDREDAAATEGLNWQQRELMQKSGGSSGGRGGGRGGHRGGDRAGSQPRAGGFRSGGAAASDLPEWAVGMDTAPSSQASAGDASLNWQQKSLMSKDDRDPFSRFVRGEDEYVRE